MKRVTIFSIFILFTSICFSQTEPTKATGAFPETVVSLNLSPITLPGAKTTIAGAETDILIAPSDYLSLGETALVGSNMTFVGGRGEYTIEPVSNWIQNHSPNLNGYKFQFRVTGSLGVVKPVGGVGNSHWGERAGVLMNYAFGNQWGLGFDAEWGNFPGVAHNTWTLGFGPNFHF